MADHIVRAQVSIPHASGVPEMDITNTFHFNVNADAITDLVPQADQDAIKQALFDFYGTDTDDGISFQDNLMHSGWKMAQATVKLYDLTDPEPRVPIEVDGSMGWSNASPADNLPPELAMVISFVANMPSGSIQARRRGRVYIGPFNQSANDTLDGRVSSTARIWGSKVAERLRDDPDTRWAIYSPTTIPSPEPGDTAFGVLLGWVDDEWDHQERREYPTVSKTAWGL